MELKTFCKVLGAYVHSLSDPDYASSYRGLLHLAEECNSNYRLRAPLIAYALLTKSPAYTLRLLEVCPALEEFYNQFSEPYDKVSCYNDLYRFSGYTDLSKIKDAVETMHRMSITVEHRKSNIVTLLREELSKGSVTVEVLAARGNIAVSTARRVLSDRPYSVSLSTLRQMLQAVPAPPSSPKPFVRKRRDTLSVSSNSMLGGYFD